MDETPSILQRIMHLHGIQSNIVGNATQYAARLAARLCDTL
jgi:hypothetical protein